MKKCKQPILTNLEEKHMFDDDFMFSEYHVSDVHFEYVNRKMNECVFKSTFFEECKFIKGDFLDVVFENCDCSNMDFSESSFHRVVFKNCRMIGTDFTKSVLCDVQFVSCKMTLVNLSSCSLKNCVFKNCDCLQSGFIESKFKDCVLDSCNFTQAEFIHTPLEKLDFSSSVIEGIVCTPDALKGIIVNSYQALELSRLLGIVIKE